MIMIYAFSLKKASFTSRSGPKETRDLRPHTPPCEAPASTYRLLRVRTLSIWAVQPPAEAITFGLKERRIFVGSEDGNINCINAVRTAVEGKDVHGQIRQFSSGEGLTL